MKYYLHSTDSFNDEKIAELFLNFGYEGLGLFYTILEKIGYSESPIKTSVLKHQLKVGKKLEKCWKFMESLGLISSNNGETFNLRILSYSEKYQIKKEKNRERILKHRENQQDTKNVTHYNVESIPPKVNINKSKVNIKENKIESNTVVANATDERWLLWVDTWFNFYTAKVGIKPNFSGAEAKALKTIRKYLSENCPGENSPDENGLTAWNQILDNWQCQDQWMITQLELKIISSKINIVLTNIKKHSDAKQFKSQPINNLSNTAKELDEYFAKRYPKQQPDAG